MANMVSKMISPSSPASTEAVVVPEGADTVNVAPRAEGSPQARPKMHKAAHSSFLCADSTVHPEAQTPYTKAATSKTADRSLTASRGLPDAHSFNPLEILGAKASIDARAKWAPVILGLKDGDTLPPEAIAELDSRVLGELIVERLALQTPPALVEGDSYNIERESELQIYFHVQFAGEVAKRGLINSHQVTDIKGAAIKVWGRTQMEERLVRLRWHELPHFSEIDMASYAADPVQKLKPKYANVDLTRNVRLCDAGYDKGCSVYGACVAVLKDDVKKRATWMWTDSTHLHDAERLDGDVVRTFDRPVPTNSVYRNGGPYVEAQIYGEVGIQDVKEFLVAPDIDPDALAKLKATGLPVYAYRDSNELGRQRRVRDRRL